MKREPFEFSRVMKNFRSPAVLLRRRFDVAQHGANINRLAEIAAKIFTEFLHAENFTQRREGGKPNFTPFSFGVTQLDCQRISGILRFPKI